MSLDLGNIKIAIKPTKEKKTGTFFITSSKVQISPEEMFQLSNLASQTRARHFSNTYYLNLNVKYNVLCCQDCTTNPSI